MIPLSRQLLRMPICGNTRGGTVTKLSRTRHGMDTKMHYKANWICCYGAEDDLTAWHVLCRAIGVEPLPKTCEKCEEARDCATKAADSC